MARLFHFSEDPDIAAFVPHVPATNPHQPPSVWAIDADHEPLYWFPRDCPRVTAFVRPDDDPAHFAAAFATNARRVHAVELGWLSRIRSVELYRYEFEPDPFEPWPEADGQWLTHQSVSPISTSLVGDLLQRHAVAGIELRLVANLWALADLAVDDRWGFSLVRMRNAKPRPAAS